MGLRHAYVATGPDDPGSEASLGEWNADHTITEE